MAKLNLPPAEIHERTGLALGSIYTILSKARAKGIDLPSFKRGRPRGELKGGVILRLPQTLVTQLELAAEDRETTPRELATTILGVVIAEGLIDAVLDDGGTR
ncbi:hypothetical protein [Pseudaestuariivita sp.]|uniref:hypothetical protein n=1 Tax=Pseudaestuariivita sp. TaxID=2211669 RepID=UPI00405A30E3